MRRRNVIWDDLLIVLICIEKLVSRVKNNLDGMSDLGSTVEEGVDSIICYILIYS